MDVGESSFTERAARRSPAPPSPIFILIIPTLTSDAPTMTKLPRGIAVQIATLCMAGKC